LFFLVGMIEERPRPSKLSALGGLAAPAPPPAAFFLITTLSSMGLPLLSNFVGGFLILLGTFQERPTFAVLAAIGAVLSAACMLAMCRRVFFGEPGVADSSAPEIDLRERIVSVAAVVVMLVMGVGSPHFLRRMDVSVAALLDQAGRREIRVDHDASPPPVPLSEAARR
jgi:NADH-quinone oxidoreductase subunit M